MNTNTTTTTNSNTSSSRINKYRRFIQEISNNYGIKSSELSTAEMIELYKNWKNNSPVESTVQNTYASIIQDYIQKLS